MKKSKLQVTFAHVDVFRCDVALLVGERSVVIDWSKEVMKPDRHLEFLEIWNNDKNSPTRQGSMYPMGGGGSVIWLPVGYKMCTLVHEIAHAAHHIMIAKGMPVSEDNTETLAYLVEHIYERLSAA